MRSSPRMELAHGTERSTDFAGDALVRARLRPLVFFGVGLVDASTFILSSLSASTFDYIRLIWRVPNFEHNMFVLGCKRYKDTKP